MNNSGNVEWLYKQGNFSHTKHLNEIIKILFFTQFKSYTTSIQNKLFKWL